MSNLTVKQKWNEAWSRARYELSCFRRNWHGYPSLHRGGESYKVVADAALAARQAHPTSLARRLELTKTESYW